jgi:hypothetical protein
MRLLVYVTAVTLSIGGPAALASPRSVAFDSPRQFAAGGGSPTVGDFNGDGVPDIASLGHDSVSSSLGDGRGGGVPFVLVLAHGTHRPDDPNPPSPRRDSFNSPSSHSMAS